MSNLFPMTTVRKKVSTFITDIEFYGQESRKTFFCPVYSSMVQLLGTKRWISDRQCFKWVHNGNKKILCWNWVWLVWPNFQKKKKIDGRHHGVWYQFNKTIFISMGLCFFTQLFMKHYWAVIVLKLKKKYRQTAKVYQWEQRE